MLPQNLISWSKVPVCSLRTLVLMDIFDQYKEWFELLLKKKYGDITAGLIVCGDDYPLEATIARRCLKLILYPRFRRVVYKIVKEESRLFGYNTVWALLPPVECLDEAFLELMRAAIRITRRG